MARALARSGCTILLPTSAVTVGNSKLIQPLSTLYGFVPVIRSTAKRDCHIIFANLCPRHPTIYACSAHSLLIDMGLVAITPSSSLALGVLRHGCGSVTAAYYFGVSVTETSDYVTVAIWVAVS